MVYNFFSQLVIPGSKRAHYLSSNKTQSHKLDVRLETSRV